MSQTEIKTKPLKGIQQPNTEELQAQVIDLFVNGVRLLGLPKSVGEIYGFLYITPDPQALDSLVERLGISKGSASQGLKFLRNLGAVEPVTIDGDRRVHYRAQTKLKELVAGFINGELVPHLESGTERLARLEELVDLDDSENAEFYRARLGKLTTWQTRGGETLDLVKELLS